MRWHTNNVEPDPQKEDSHFIIVSHNKYYFTSWASYRKKFCTSICEWSLDDIEKWCYIEEDDCNTDEMFALNAIYDAVKHVQSLYNILLTDGICCGNEYRDLVGLNELQIIKDKLSKRILYLDDQIKI